MMAIQYPAAVCCRCKQKPLKKEKQRANSVSWFALSLSLPFSLFVGCLSVYRTPHRTHFMRFSVHFPKHTEREQVPIRCSNNTERTNRGKNTRVIWLFNCAILLQHVCFYALFVYVFSMLNINATGETAPTATTTMKTTPFTWMFLYSRLLCLLLLLMVLLLLLLLSLLLLSARSSHTHKKCALLVCA